MIFNTFLFLAAIKEYIWLISSVDRYFKTSVYLYAKQKRTNTKNYSLYQILNFLIFCKNFCLKFLYFPVHLLGIAPIFYFFQKLLKFLALQSDQFLIEVAYILSQFIKVSNTTKYSVRCKYRKKNHGVA